MGVTFGFDKQGTRRIVDAVRYVEKVPRFGVGMQRPLLRGVEDREHIWHPFKNESGEAIPAGGVVDLTDYDSETGNFTAGKPGAFGATFPLAVNSLESVADDDFGICTWTFPALVYYDNSNTPANGEHWGPVSGQFYAHLRSPGFVVLGIEDADDQLMWVDRSVQLSTFCELDSSTVAQDATGTFSVHYFATGTWTEDTDASLNFTARNASDTTITTSLRCAANWDWSSGQWIVLPFTC